MTPLSPTAHLLLASDTLLGLWGTSPNWLSLHTGVAWDWSHGPDDRAGELGRRSSFAPGHLPPLTGKAFGARRAYLGGRWVPLPTLLPRELLPGAAGLGAGPLASPLLSPRLPPWV